MADRPESLAAALAELQQHLPRIGKDSAAVVETKTGRTYGYKYANLATISAVLLPVMGELGLSFTCYPSITNPPGTFVLHYELTHVCGEFREGSYPLPVSGTPQQIGSAITYARRYCLLAVTGAAPDEDDDDAQAAEDAARAQRNAPPETRADGSATEAEQMRMVRGHEPGTERYHQPPPDESQWQDEPGQPLDPPAEKQPRSILPVQKTAMFAQFNGLRIRDQKGQLDFMEEVLGWRPPHRDELSLVEARAVLDALAERSRAQ